MLSSRKKHSTSTLPLTVLCVFSNLWHWENNEKLYVFSILKIRKIANASDFFYDIPAVVESCILKDFKEQI